MPTLTVTKTYANEQVLTEQDLDNIKNSIETFVNITLLGSDNLQTSSVGTSQLSSTAVTTEKLANGAVTDLKISASASDDSLRAVGTNAIKDAAVTTPKIADGNVTLAKLIAAVQQALVPAGSVLAFGATSASTPSGWLYCDGSAISRTTYAALYAVVGNNFGSGDGSTTFNIPDFRGRFIRGTNAGTGRDPNAGARTAMNSGGATGDDIGTLQDSATGSHTHTIAAKTPSTAIVGTTTVVGNIDGGGGSVTAIADLSGGSTLTTLTIPTVTGSTGASTETRPINANMNYIIKY